MARMPFIAGQDRGGVRHNSDERSRTRSRDEAEDAGAFLWLDHRGGSAPEEN